MIWLAILAIINILGLGVLFLMLEEIRDILRKAGQRDADHNGRR